MKLVLDHKVDRGSHMFNLSSALGRVLAEDVSASSDSPRFDSSAMDGWAVGSEAGPWRIMGESAAGSSADLALSQGEACRIFTGARVPQGALSILPQEEAQVQGDLVISSGTIVTGSHIRRQGEEMAAGACLIEAGTIITPGILGALASQGLAQVRASVPLRVTLISTGTEIVPPGQPLTGSNVYESNSWSIVSDLTSSGHEVIHHMVRDDSNSTRAALKDAAMSSDLVLTIGGISVGDYDLVGPSFESIGGRIIFRGVKMKPGKPVSFGTLPAGSLWFGLPGNPMSCWTTYCLFVRSLWNQGSNWRRAVWSLGFSRKPGREEFMPVELIDGEAGAIKPITAVGSHSVSAFTRAHALARISSDASEINQGEPALITFLPGGLR